MADVSFCETNASKSPDSTRYVVMEDGGFYEIMSLGGMSIYTMFRHVHPPHLAMHKRIRYSGTDVVADLQSCYTAATDGEHGLIVAYIECSVLCATFNGFRMEPAPKFQKHDIFDVSSIEEALAGKRLVSCRMTIVGGVTPAGE